MPVGARIAALAWATVVVLQAQQPPDALAIMRQVADRTGAAVEARRQYVYHQRARSGLMKSNGETVCRESREYNVVPRESTTERVLTAFHGECRQGQAMVPYSLPGLIQPGVAEKPVVQDHIAAQFVGDRETITGVIDDLASDSKTRDGIPRRLFPLDAREIARYKFTLKGETTIRNRRAYDILFEPPPKSACLDMDADECSAWKGEAWIDAEDFQPIRIQTELAKGVPWAVRVFLGVNIRQLGFSLTYERVAPGVWFPSTYGTEFRIMALWAYRRTITLSMENTDFRKTDAQSTIQFDTPQNQAPASVTIPLP